VAVARNHFIFNHKRYGLLTSVGRVQLHGWSCLPHDQKKSLWHCLTESVCEVTESSLMKSRGECLRRFLCKIYCPCSSRCPLLANLNRLSLMKVTTWLSVSTFVWTEWLDNCSSGRINEGRCARCQSMRRLSWPHYLYENGQQTWLEVQSCSSGKQMYAFIQSESSMSCSS
jgi:hypothetical protein